MRYVNLTTVEDSYQAYFLKKALEDEGMKCIITNENTNAALQLAGPIGAMIQIRVAEPDLEAATKVLQKLKADTDAVICPNCGSKNVQYGFGIKNRLRNIAAVTFSVLFLPFASKYHFVYACRDCLKEFRKNKY